MNNIIPDRRNNKKPIQFSRPRVSEQETRRAPMITDPLFYLVAIPAVLITGVSKGGFGGIALLAVPLMALVVSPTQAAGIMLPILLVMDVFGMHAYRGIWHKSNLKVLLVGAIVGITIGTFTARSINEEIIRLILGIIAVLFTIHFWLRGRTADAVKNPNSKIGVFLGAISGYTSFVAHAGAPAFQFFMLPQKLDRKLYAGTAVLYFTILNVLKIIPYALLGMLAVGNLYTSLVLLPLAPFGIWLGVWLNKKVSNELFYHIMYTAIFVVGLRLCWDAFAA